MERVSQQPHRLNVREHLVLSFLWFSLNVQSAALLPIVIPTQILLYITPGSVGNAQQATFLSWLSTISACMSLIVPPIIGLLSDHTTSAFGRRRPYIAVGSVCLLFSVLILVKAGSAFVLLIGLILFQVMTSVILSAYQSLFPDRVPQEQRGASSGYVGLMTILGNVSGLILAGLLLGQITLTAANSGAIRRGVNIYYLATTLTLVVGVLVTLIGVREKPYSPPSALPVQARDQVIPWLRRWIVRNWVQPWRDFNFTLVFLTRFSVMMGLTLFLTFIEYYFANVAHVSNFIQATAILAVLALLGAVASAFTFGVFSDRVRRAPLVSFATTCMALASIAFFILPGSFPLWPLGVLFGLGYGAYTSVDWALSIDALPSMETVGKDLGLWNASVSLPAIFAPLLGGLIIALANIFGQTILGYRIVFASAAVFLVIGAIFILYVREPRRAQVQEQQPAAPATSLKQPSPRRAVNLGWKLAFQTRAGQPRGFLRFWPIWESIMLTIWPVQPIPGAPNNLLRVRFKRYHGRPVHLPDGVQIHKGDPVIELHFSNIAALQAVMQSGRWSILRMLMEDLHTLAAWMQQPDFPSHVRAIYGITLLSRAAPRLGFTVRERPKNLYTWLDRFFMTGLLVLYSEEGTQRLLQGSTYGSYPQEVWMSRETLLERYGHSSST